MGRTNLGPSPKTTMRCRVSRFFGASILAIGVSACGPSSGTQGDTAETPTDSSTTALSTKDVADDDLIRATGVWEIQKRNLPESYVFADAAAVGDEILVASGTTLRNVECDPSIRPFPEGTVTASVEVGKYSNDTFEPVATLDLIDQNLSAVYIADVTGDGMAEILVDVFCTGSNYATNTIRAFERGATSSDWAEMPSTGAFTYENGMLTTFNKDCRPYCAAGGLELFRISWNGAAFVKEALIAEDGTVVDLSVTETCPKFRQKKRLPLDICDRGPLAEKFVILARSMVGDYGPETSLAGALDRITPEVAKWIKTYRYRHGLPINTVLDGELFAKVGEYWPPTEDSDSGTDPYLFDSFCTNYLNAYECDSYGYLFPTEECANYRPPSDQKLPLKKCDYGLWVARLMTALDEIDGNSSEANTESALYDSALEERVRVLQTARGLEADGLAGSNTWRELFGAISPDMEFYDSNGDGMFSPGDMIPD
jgi:hypothetical protein